MSPLEPSVRERLLARLIQRLVLDEIARRGSAAAPAFRAWDPDETWSLELAYRRADKLDLSIVDHLEILVRRALRGDLL